jgi:hypothetical protein
LVFFDKDFGSVFASFCWSNALPFCTLEPGAIELLGASYFPRERSTKQFAQASHRMLGCLARALTRPLEAAQSTNRRWRSTPLIALSAVVTNSRLVMKAPSRLWMDYSAKESPFIGSHNSSTLSGVISSVK